MTVNTQKPIVIFRGDNTAAFDLRTIRILLTGDLDLTNATARFDLLDFTKSWTTEEVATGELSIVFDSAQTKSFALGPQVGTLRLYDMSTGTPRQLTIVNKIPFFVTNRVCEIDSQSYEADVCVSGGDVIHIEFKVGAGAVEGKADKVKNATAGDLASLTADGNLEDSGIPKTDVLRKSQMDSTPTAGSQNPVTSDGIKQAIDAATPSDYAQVKAQVEQNTTDISTINGKIPAQASAQNQLADKDFVNSSIATNTATFRGSYNAYSELGVSPPYPLTTQGKAAIATAIATKLASLVPPVEPENNDYCFVQVPRNTQDPADFDPTVIERVDRYKCTVTESGGVTTSVWEYEWSLNNSSFTADQWAAINSGITSGLVDKLINLPSAEELLGKGYLVFQPSRNGFDGVSGDTAAIQRNASSLWGYNPSADSNYSVGFLIDPVAYSGAAIKNGSYYVSADPLANYITSYHQILLSSLTIDLYVSSNGVSDIRLSVKDASGANTLFSSDWIDEITTGTAARFEFSFPGNDVWLDGGTQYRFVIEGRDAFGDEMSASVRLLRNQIYTYAQNKGVKWSSILANGTTVETQDYALEMTMGVTATITAQIPLANLMDVGFMGFSELTKYHTGDRCVYDGALYECTPSGNNHQGPWVANHFKLVMSLSDNITMGGALPFSAHGNPTSNIILGFNAASAAGSQNIVLGYSATAHRTDIGTYSDTTSGNVVIGAAATVDNNGSPNFAPNDNVVIGKYSKSHGSYDVVLGVNSEVTGDSGLAIGNNAKVTHDGAIAIGNNAVSNGEGTATLAISALNKFFLGSDNIVDLINAAVNTAIQNQTIAAAVSTTTATGGGRRLLAAATPTSTTKTEVTAADIGALGNTGSTMYGSLNVSGGLVVGSTGGSAANGEIKACGISACSFSGLPDAGRDTDNPLVAGVVVIGNNITTDMYCAKTRISVPIASSGVAGVVKISGHQADEYGGAYIKDNFVTVGIADSNRLGVVKIGSNINVNSSGVISVQTADSNKAGVVRLDDIPINCGCSFAGSSGAHLFSVTPYGLSLGLRYMIPHRGSSGGYDAHDRQIRHLNRSDMELAAQSSISLPTQNNQYAARDFIVDVDYRTDDSSAIAHTLRLGSDYGTAWRVCVAEGEDLTDILTFNPGEAARLYFTETAFGSVNDAPVFLIARQNVDMVEVSNG